MPSQILHTAGARLMNTWWTGTSRPANLFLLLRTLDGASGHTSDAALADTMTSNLFEASGGGYARISVAFNNTNFVESASGASSLMSAAQQTYTFTGTVTGITHAAWGTTSDTSGTLLMSAPASVTRNFANTDTYKVIFTWLLEQGA